MNTQDIERFIAGTDEINRQRKIITRVINCVVSLVENARYNWGNKSPVQVGLEQFGNFQLLKGKRHQPMVRFTANESWWNSYGESIPFNVVPVLFSRLSEIVDKTHEMFPELGIRAHIQFFIDQAPDSK